VEETAEEGAALESDVGVIAGGYFELIGEEVGPLIDEGGRADQLLNETGPFVRRAAFEEGANLLGLRDPAGQVDRDAAQELGVGGEGGGRDAGTVDGIEDVIVDEVIPGDGGARVGGAGARLPVLCGELIEFDARVQFGALTGGIAGAVGILRENRYDPQGENSNQTQKNNPPTLACRLPRR